MKENVKFDKKSLKLVQGKTCNFGELAKDCVAFANSYGGCIAIGIEDEAELPDPNQVVPQDLPEKVVKRINELTLKSLIAEDLKFHPQSLLSEIAARLPDVNFQELEKMVRKMAKEGEINYIGGRKYRKYLLP